MRRLSFLLFLFAVLVLAFAARVANLRDIFVDGAIYFVDADCYSRMTRVRMILDRPGTIVREHTFENAPQGTTPHTTAPMDYLIVASKWVCDGALRLVDWKGTSVLRGQTVDFAGAIVSLILGLAACAWVAIWARIMELGAGRSTALSGSAPRPWPRGSWAAAPFFFAISPIIVHGTSLGRPDHQSLLVLLLAIALGAECRLARTSSLRWMLLSGAAWGLALWVSFYEPLILLVAVVLTWLICAPRRFFSRDRLAALYIFAAICLLAWLIEGWRIRKPESDMLIFLANWNQTIGELKHLRLTEPTLYEWLGWGCLASPVLLGVAMRYYRRAFPLLAVLLILFGLTCWQLRWGYFLALGYAMTLPWQLAILRRPWIAWFVFILSLWPLFREWDQRLFPDDRARARRAQHQIESTQLRDLAEELRQREPGQDAIFLAPWWHSPAIVYWSGLPGVAGSSHESLAGIVDSARVYLATAPDAMTETLRARKVRWLIAADPDGVVSTSAKLLDTHAPKETVASLLAQQPHSVAPFLQPVFANDFFKLFIVDETKFPQ